MTTLAHLAVEYPSIPWSEPIPITVDGKPPILCCRVCIALHGIRAEDVPGRGFEDRDQFLHHLREHT